MFHYQNNRVFGKKVVYIKQRKLLVKHIVDMPFVAPTGRVMGSLAGQGGLSGVGGIAGKRGGLAG